MTIYVMLANWTDQGVRGIDNSATRWDAAKKMLHDMGGRIRDFYMTMGEYDLVVVYACSGNAFRVFVRTFPSLPSMSVNRAAIASSGASYTTTRSYSPIVM